MCPQLSSHVLICCLLALASFEFSLSIPSPVPQTCTYIYQPIGNQMSCRGAQNSQRSYTCNPNTCKGTTTCETCVSQLTNVSVNSVDCIHYYVDENHKTNCWASPNEQFTCYGKCDGAAVCSDCTLDQQTPSISNSAPQTSGKHHSKAPTTTSTSTESVPTWLSYD